MLERSNTMELKFKTLDEVNAFLLKDMTPLEYCKMVIADTINEIQKHITLDGDPDIDTLHLFWHRQCGIYLKNNTLIIWDIEMTPDQIVLPNLDDIVYVDFDTIPWKAPSDFKVIKSYGYCNLGKFCDLIKPVKYGLEYCFDSIHGAYLHGDDYYNSNEYQRYNNDNSRSLFREYPDFQVEVYTKGKEKYTYFANFKDGCIGAYVAEQILLSNQPESRSLTYGNNSYKSKAAILFPMNKIRHGNTQREYLNHLQTECEQIIHKIYRSLSSSRRSMFDFPRCTAIAVFIYMYFQSLCGFSDAENFTLIYPIFCNYLKENASLKRYEKEKLISEINRVCHANYYGEPPVKNPETVLEQFQAAVWALVNSTTYMEAIRNILNFVEFQHAGQLAVSLTGAFAGIYYQHYRIPQNYLTENRYYTHFFNSVIPMEKIRFYAKR